MAKEVERNHINITMAQKELDYPCPRRDESVVETHFGTNVPDPYRWLEDPDSEETQGFVKAQNEISQPYLASCPVRNKFHARSEMNAIVSGKQ